MRYPRATPKLARERLSGILSGMILIATNQKFFGGTSSWRPRRVATLLSLAGLLAGGPALRAGVLYVPNAGFESQPTTFAVPQIGAWQKTAQPGTFDTNTFGAWDNLAGVFMNPPAGYPGSIDNADGGQLAFLFAYPQMGLFQDYNSTDWSGATTHAFAATFEPGRSYHLTVGLTSSSYEPLAAGSTLRVSLYYRDPASNAVTVASTNVTFDPAVFTNLSHLLDFQVTVPTVNATDAWAGQHLGIAFESTAAPALIGGVWDLDHVRLTETIDVPNFSFESQPTTFALPQIDAWQKTAQPGTFDTNTFGAWDNLAGVFMNPPAGYPGSIDNADGGQLAFLLAYPQMGLFQDYSSIDWSSATPSHAFHATFDAGMAYTLTVGLTSSSYEPLAAGSTLQMSLYYRDGAGRMVPIAATSVTFDPAVFTNLSHLLDFSVSIPEVKPSDPWAGQYIGIQFMATTAPNLIGGVWDLDNVRLVETVATGLKHPQWSAGQFTSTLRSEPGLGFEILAATNLAQAATNWTSLATFTNLTGSFSFTDPAAGAPQRFYRVRPLP